MANHPPVSQFRLSLIPLGFLPAAKPVLVA